MLSLLSMKKKLYDKEKKLKNPYCEFFKKKQRIYIDSKMQLRSHF